MFYDAVRVFMNEWPVLKLAVQQGFGGIDSQEKGKWMIDVVIQVLTENSKKFKFQLIISNVFNSKYSTSNQ